MLPSTHPSMLLAMSRQDGRDDAWRAFDRHYREPIMAWCRRGGLQFASAEDVTQMILIKLFDRLHLYDPAKGRFRGWLKQIVRNTIIDVWRARDGDERAVGDEALQTLAAAPAIEELTTTIESRGGEIAKETINRVKDRVAASSWNVFVALVLEDRKAADVAASHDVKVASVYKTSYRIRKMISEEFANVDQHHDHAASK